ncbi:hypothetical protein WR25_19082 [Diploscapter pachys]|uniref:Fidgetin-like protein 1 n=1 Tax=Diploscapter pachys TaxID=2018661 RepID=A0A2A2L0P3_9BILA|nr:hypothetical protein WR25_19082 [Diploscapter pachys]
MANRRSDTPDLYRDMTGKSPYFLGKQQQKKKLPDEEQTTPKTGKENRTNHSPEVARGVKHSVIELDDDFVLEDSPIKNPPPSSSNAPTTLAPAPRNSSSRKEFAPPPPSKKVKVVETTSGSDMFSCFKNDPKVQSIIRRKINAEIVDPGEKNKNQPSSSILDERIKAQSEYIINGKKEKRPKATERRGFANTNEFKLASGAPANKATKFMPPIVNGGAGSAKESNKDDEAHGFGPGSANTSRNTKFYGNKPMNGAFTGNFSTKKAIEMTMSNDGSGPDHLNASAKQLQNEPSLKNFDAHIIELIDSEIMSVTRQTGWSDVAGLEGAKKALREIVVLPFLRPEIFKGIRAPPKGVLLFGPPGTGKTMIGKCVASQCHATFFNISASSLTSKWVGEGEKLVRALFAVARIKLPSVIFIDEIDSLLSSRNESEHESSRRIKTEFLVQLDGVATNQDERLLVIGATNRPQELDEAARRRFAKRLYIGLPEYDARENIVKNLLTGMEHELADQDMKKIAELTMGYSGADMRQLCAEAAMGPIRDIDNNAELDIETVQADEIRKICLKDFVEGAEVVRPTVIEQELTAYKEWDKKFGCLR